MPPILDEISKALRKYHIIIKVFKSGGALIGGALISSANWLGEEVPFLGQNSDTFMVVGIVLVLLSVVLIIFIDDTAPGVIKRNLDLDIENRDLVADIRYLADYSRHTLATLSVMSGCRGILDYAINDIKASNAWLSEFSVAVLKIITERKCTLFGIGDEYWNFSVYFFDADQRRLNCLGCSRPDGYDFGDNHRSWASGEGHIGLAFARGQEIVFSDASRDELKAVLGTNGSNYKPDDSVNYRSLASLPISLNGEEPIGVIIATSDVVGRFKNEYELEERDWDRIEVLRQAAGFLAILYEMQQNHGKTGEKLDATPEEQS